MAASLPHVVTIIVKKTQKGHVPPPSFLLQQQMLKKNTHEGPLLPSFPLIATCVVKTKHKGGCKSQACLGLKLYIFIT